MRIEQTILTAEPIPDARSLSSAYFERLGYRIVDNSDSIVLERGSKAGSIAGFKTTQWFVRTVLQFAPGPGESTQIAVQMDIDTTGQMVIEKERQKWIAEFDGLVEVVNGQVPLSARQSSKMDEKSPLEQQCRSGANWFFWIAGLSILNSVIWRLGSSLTFVVGLNVTQVIDVLAFDLASYMPEYSTLVSILAIVIDLVLAGAIALFGFFARKKQRWAFIVGMILYVADGLIFLLAFDLPGLLFHLLALWGLSRGLLALNRLQQAERPVQASVHLPA